MSPGDREPVLLGVHPTRPERMFIFIVGSPGPGRLASSDDGGATLTPLLSDLELNGYAATPDGSDLWVGADQGLWRSRDGGDSFEPIDKTLAVGCLEYSHDRLWLCGDDADDGFALGVSDDRGDSVEPVLRFADVTSAVECADADLTRVCQTALDIWSGGVTAPSDAGSTGDASSPDEDAAVTMAGGDKSGCGCHLARAGRRTNGWLLLSIVPLLARRRFHRPTAT